MTSLPDPLQARKADHEILPLFLQRWSPRAMSGEPLTSEELHQVLEAARWAPSTFNEQEWRFLYARRDTEFWPVYFNLLAEANQAWCDRAGVLIVLASHRVFSRNGRPNPVHTFDAGAAFENLVLQAAHMGLVAHGMAGFDRGRAQRELQIPDDYEVEAMIALGRPGDPAQLSAELREREQPTDRKPLAEISCEGRFSL